MKNFFIIYTALTLLLLNWPLHSLENAFYTVTLTNFSGKVYSQDTSRYRIISNDSEFTLPETSTQRILKSSLENSICQVTLESGNIRNIVDEKKETYAKFLSNSRLLNLDDPEIQKIKSGFKNSKDIINDVEQFVYKYINDKSIGIPLMSTSDIIKNKSGDCTEHTVLAVSILRSLGIPARALVGMILSAEFGGIKNVFVYHMWAEAFVADRWILVDAANPGVKHANRYIAFAYHHLQTEMPLAYLKAVSAMKNFSVEYLE